MEQTILAPEVAPPSALEEAEFFADSSCPIRAAPYSVEHLEEHVRAIAAQHSVAAEHENEQRLWRQFDANVHSLEESYAAIVAAVHDGEQITPGAEWLLDNFYIVRDQLREIREDLPRRFYRELPKLTAGPLAGFPRVYSLALEIVAHTDSALDAATLARSIKAYQEARPLTMGEVWAVPIMLRLALVENLRRLADRIQETQAHRRQADTWANQIIEERPSDPAALLAQHTAQHPRLPPPLISQLVERFRDQGHDLAECWHWLERRLSQEGVSIEELVREEHRRKACDQVSTGNAITSMRLVSAMDWSGFFEETSLVEQELRRDPADVYARMDFATRDRYRHAVEKLARRAKLPEWEVAKRLVNEARRADGDPLEGHIGYYLLDKGRERLEATLRVSLSPIVRLRRWLKCRAPAVYLTSLSAVWLAILVAILCASASLGVTGGWLVLVALMAAIPTSELAVGIVNYLATSVLQPHVLPRMDFRAAIPPDSSTMVVMPTLLVNRENLRGLISRLEVHYLANPDQELAFALLTDFADAAHRELPEDASLLAEALERIDELNHRYGAGKQRFWLFHRARRWNEAEGKWMGWERKRGKIAEFNRLLRGATDTSYVLPERLPAELADVRYVITLDADTQLPLGAARRLVSTIAHPLNQPRLNESGSRVVRGYAILQPRVNISATSASRSLFARIFSGNPHVDPYVTAVSDVYQDAFAEGSYTGKGIYEVDAFEATVGDTFPDNHILSHDLIEGCHSRAALVTDIEVYDDFPMQYHAYARRQHRWVRGDWQLLPWLWWHVPHRTGARPNPLAVISRWKLLDNLRRSLTPPALVAMVVVGWLLTPNLAALWFGLALAVIALPLITHVTSIVSHRPRDVAWRPYLAEVANQLGISLLQTLLALVFLPHQAYLMADAITRTVYRLAVSRRHLLEWETAYATERRLGKGLNFFIAEMWASPAIAVLTATLFVWQGHFALLAVTAPVFVLWFVSPGVAWRLSRPIVKPDLGLTDRECRELRAVARRTWLFFETFVGAEDHWLPPDNYQEDPKGVIAHRTSPTNEGLYLVSSLAAYDFGYLGFDRLADVIERNLDSWTKLEHYRGHPYNWYDTQTLGVLLPAYVSTVDSGNLAVCALTVQRGLLDAIGEKLLGARGIAGLSDTLELVRELLVGAEASPTLGDTCGQVDRLHDMLISAEANTLHTPNEWNRTLSDLEVEISCLANNLRPTLVESTGALDPLATRIAALESQVAQLRQETDRLFPWLASVVDEAPAGATAIPVPAWKTSSAQLGDWRTRWLALWRALNHELSLRDVAHLPQKVESLIQKLAEAIAQPEVDEADRHVAQLWIDELRIKVAAGASVADELMARLRELAERLRELALSMDFTFLYDQQRSLFSIGYNHSNSQLDRGHYDLLASEARLASFLAIGKGDVDHRHWFHLGRPLTQTAGASALLSWGGTMFEYLMPSLFLRTFPETLLAQSCVAAVDRQIEFGEQRQVPWGVSESAFATFDSQQNYQYRSFGVPGLGLKRGLGDDLVVAPYATGLAIMVRPHEGLLNLRALSEEGAAGAWGFYEAIDYTRSRLPPSESKAVIRCYFAHHQGMLLTALNNCLLGQRMQHRFHREPMARAAELLLQERIPVAAPHVQPHGDEVTQPPVVRETDQEFSRWITTPHTATPRTQLLSNGRYSLMITNAGAGYSHCQGTRITRWRPDTTCDSWGQFIYLRDSKRGALWSATYQPTGKAASEYEVLFSVDKAEFRRRDEELETHLEVAVSPDNDVEARLVTITNHSLRTRVIDVTSYAELVLGTAEADLAHPAFQKLFVQTEYVPDFDALLAWRRPRSAGEPARWAMHVVAVEESQRDASHAVEYETDRARFVGRGRTPASPAACAPGATLTGTVGPVLDPIFSLRRQIQIPPDKSVRIAFSTACVGSREEALALADQYHDLRVVLRAFELAWAHAQVELRHVHLSASNIHLYQRLASLLLYPDAAKRAPPAVIAANRQGQSGLWKYGISGDFPIVVARITETEQTSLVRELLLAHEHWRLRDLVAELVILNEYPTSYMDAVQEQLNGLVGESGSWDRLNKRGGIFVLQTSRIPEEDKTLLFAAAHVVLHGAAGPLERQLDITPTTRRLPATLRPARKPDTSKAAKPSPSKPIEQELIADNSYGGFTSDGKEYVIRLGSGRWTPAPWSNVIAGPRFGCLVTESGLGSTWAENSRENRLTPWSNDPVSDGPAEAVYVRDEETGEFWNPTPLPIRDSSPYTVRHGQGYSIFEHQSHGVSQRLHVTIAAEDPVKIVRLWLRNDAQTPRRLSATYHVDWVLGVFREQNQLHVVTEADEASGALLATNAYNQEFGGRVAFLHIVGRAKSFTADRQEFFGRNGSWTNPAAMRRAGLSARVGAGFDPCGTVQTAIRLGPGEETEIVFLLGQVASRQDLAPLLSRYEKPENAIEVADETAQRWDELLSTIEVRTPNPAFDLLVNRWLLYQTLGCRFWGRTAFYQSGGAYGYRDQLQDSMALVYGRPDLAREQIVRAAGRQFAEGDVQHWWHPPSGRGVRTRFSDDFLWLPFVVAHYLDVTGDLKILEETARFVRSSLLGPEEEERYELPEVSDETDTIYGHCLRAIENGRRLGAHGLPLMGCGDWNDGMNKVGAHGQGESVWVAWFQIVILERFASLAESRNETERVAEFRERAAALRQAIEEQAWDGAWYRRAYFDDGTPLGSQTNDACQIDSLVQTWSVIAGGDPQRARAAMQAVYERLVRDEDKLILLFWPPFDQTALEPGYIKGYLPGVRENGGQYTHAALWVVLASALLGEGDRAMRLFDLLNPLHHSDHGAAADLYKVEPYVVAADVYSQPPHTGRGGWTWYTGSSSWMYRVALENLLGFQKRGDKLTIAPCVPADWPRFEIAFRHGKATYQITVENPNRVQHGVRNISLDGVEQTASEIALLDDGATHEVRVTMG
jgi:cyclic beta-1,2-glucan synthetase